VIWSGTAFYLIHNVHIIKISTLFKNALDKIHIMTSNNSFVLKNLPEDGNAVPKHVGVSVIVMNNILLSAFVGGFIKVTVC
jgi:hypothetical protein